MTEAWKIDLVCEMRPALEPNAARNCFRSHRRNHEADGTEDTGPSSDTLVPDQSIQRHEPLAPLFHIGLLEVGTIWEPDRLPAAYPFGHRYLTKEHVTRNAL